MDDSTLLEELKKIHYRLNSMQDDMDDLQDGVIGMQDSIDGLASRVEDIERSLSE